MSNTISVRNASYEHLNAVTHASRLGIRVVTPPYMLDPRYVASESRDAADCARLLDLINHGRELDLAGHILNLSEVSISPHSVLEAANRPVDQL